MPPQLREIGFHIENHATQWHGFQHEIQFQEVVVENTQLLSTAAYNKNFVPYTLSIIPPLAKDHYLLYLKIKR